MKKFYKLLGCVGFILTPLLGNSQVFESEDFSAGIPASWTSNGFTTSTSVNTCGSEALRSNLWSANSSDDISTPAMSATGGQIDISFDYKIVDYASNTPTTGNWGVLTLEHTIDGGITWVADTVIDQSNHVPANTCATVTTITTPIEVPNGSTVQYRFSGVWNSSDYDLYIDDVNFIETVTCPLPSGLLLNSSDLTSATFSWTPGSSESEWTMEYGAPGFTPGSGAGTSSLTINNINETVTGLASNQFFDMYIRAACSAGDTSGFLGPIAFNTFNQGLYMDFNTACPTSGFIDISTTGTDLALADDGEAGITLPFSFLYQGSQLISEVSIGNNGDLKLGTLTGTSSFSGNMNTLADGLYPWLDDLDAETGGVFYETVGTAPNQVFIAQWHERCNFSGSIGAPNVTFQIQIEEATGEIYFVYDDPIFGDAFAGDDYGNNADIGIAGPSQDINVSNNDPQYLTDNTCAHFFYTDCPNPVNFTVSYVTPTGAGITWDAGLATESNWTIIYGLAGFDPTLTGTTITSGTNVAILSGLTDLTDYDVYILADCDPTLQSTGGLFGTFTTLPNCSDITALNTATAEDSLFTDWMWTESSGIGTYPSTSFNVQYGPTGFNLYSGTTVSADNNFTDTTFNTAFLAGGVYEVYVQAVCGTDSSNYVGPITFTMPVTNDSTCLSEELMVDETVYTFDNTGASTQVNEITITPPTTGAQTTDGWSNANLTFTTWFTFEAPTSGNVSISGKDVGFDGQIAIYEATDCADFTTYTLLAANDDALDGTSAAPDFSVCGLTSGNTYYLMHDSWSTFNTGVYSISLREIVVEAGTTNGLLDVCTGDTVNLFDGIAGQDAGGVWHEAIPTAGFADSIFPSSGLAYQVFDFDYIVTDGCAADTSLQQVQIYGPSSAGNDGTLDVCKNEPLNLLNGLSGNVDLGGVWFDPSDNALPGADITASSIAGSFNYDYITDNGVCPADTANVEVSVSDLCDELNTEELFFGAMSVFPNPSNGIVNITNFGSTDVFSYDVTDLKGSVISGAASAISGSSTTEINLDGLEAGVYLIEVYNESARKTFRIVLQ